MALRRASSSSKLTILFSKGATTAAISSGENTVFPNISIRCTWMVVLSVGSFGEGVGAGGVRVGGPMGVGMGAGRGDSSGRLGSRIPGGRDGGVWAVLAGLRML